MKLMVICKNLLKFSRFPACRKKLIRGKTGTVLTEALVAIASLATAAIVAGTITTNSISTTILSKDYLIAQNLVTEGVEIVKNIRDTNWLLYPNKKNDCWLAVSVVNGLCTLPANNSNYIVALNNGVLYLKNAGANSLDLDNSLSSYKTPYQLYIENSRYVGYTAAPAGAVKSKFFRTVKFIDITNDTVTFVVKIQWKDGAKTRETGYNVTLNNSL